MLRRYDVLATTIRRAGGTVRSLVRRLRYGPRRGQHWVRVVMDREIEAILKSIHPEGSNVVEISGGGRAHLPWKSYKTAAFPDYDLLAPTPIGTFDVVICEQVLEHVEDPQLAMATLVSLCRPGARVVVSTPFMLKIHPAPDDYWRFTPDGLRRLYDNAGLTIEAIGSWGNQSCIRANRNDWARYRWWHRLAPWWALRNDPDLPQVVWVVGRRPSEEAR